MAVNWQQVGDDFRQKYEGTFCRFVSPSSKRREVFTILQVDAHPSSPPDLTLYNSTHGHLYLKYDTEAELDFNYPDVGYFQFKNRALRFVKNYERQWRKGMCASTCRVLFPYDELFPSYGPGLNNESVEAAFIVPQLTIENGLRKLRDDKCVSVALSRTLALGLGNKDEDRWVWFESEPIGEVKSNGDVAAHTPEFAQEIRDFIRNTEGHGRAVV